MTISPCSKTTTHPQHVWGIKARYTCKGIETKQEGN